MIRIATFIIVMFSLVTMTSHHATDASAQSTGKMYWIENISNNIERADLDGSNREVFLGSPLGVARGVVVDPNAGKMYWTESILGEVRRSNLDGSNVETVVGGLVDPRSVDLDLTTGKIYWVSSDGDRIERADTNGGNWESVITGLSTPRGIAIDSAGGKIYWTSMAIFGIRRANLDGSGIEDLVPTGPGDPSGIALDTAAGKMYWTDIQLDKIQRADLDGSNIEDVVTGQDYPEGLDIDRAGGKIYWTDPLLQAIRRANTNGSVVEDVVPALFLPADLALDISTGKLYFVDNGFEKIMRSDLDGSSLEDVVVGLSPNAIATDLVDGYLYWTDRHGNIIRAPIDTPAADETIHQGLSSCDGIVLDVGAGKMYWADGHNGMIHRSDLSGTNVEDVVTEIGPEQIALDVSNGKIYWTAPGVQKIRRSNTDGSSVEDIVDEPNYIRGFTLDTSADKMYWTVINSDTIRTANLDGNDRDGIFVLGTWRPRGIAIETGDDKMYFTEFLLGRVFRANLDGSNPDLLVTGLMQVDNIVLGMETITPTALAWSRAVPVGGGVEITWRLSKADEGVAFDVLRAGASAGVFRGLPTAAMSSDGLLYRAVDTSAEPGRSYRYRVDFTDDEGTRVLFETAAVTVPATTLALDQNYPNPFNPTTTISFQLPARQRATLAIHTPQGKLIKTLADRVFEAGFNKVEWDGTDQHGNAVGSGVYFYLLKTEKQSLARKLTLLK